MGRIVCVVDQIGRVQHQRLIMLSKELGDCDVFSLDERYNIRWKRYSLAYYSNYSIFSRVPCKIRRICSVTSHKSLDAKERTLRFLQGFHAVSVNNRYLEKEFKPHIKRLYYTPNGVDTVFFCPKEKKREGKLRVGWVGNSDRRTKNFHIVRRLVRRMNQDLFQFDVVASQKRGKLPRNKEKMRDFYQNLDCFLVTSSTEGTPNPGLEALSCGIPVISTRVGNMEEIIQEGHNGFFVSPDVRSFTDALNNIVKLSSSEILEMSALARSAIMDGQWDWKFKKMPWLKFLRDFQNG